MKFRKKPIVIEATQWFAPGDHPAVIHPVPEHRRTVGGITMTGGLLKHMALGWIDTLEGGHIVTPGDWIITGVKGERYPCKADIFAATYEAVEPMRTDE